MQRKCPHTGEIFIPKRYNQIFSSRIAQIEYNNLIARNKRLIKSPVDKVLNKNREIFLKIIGSEKEVVKSYEFLLGAEFNFKHFTNSFMLNGKPVQAIYEFIIYKNQNDTFTIKKI